MVSCKLHHCVPPDWQLRLGWSAVPLACTCGWPSALLCTMGWSVLDPTEGCACWAARPWLAASVWRYLACCSARLRLWPAFCAALRHGLVRTGSKRRLRLLGCEALAGRFGLVILLPWRFPFHSFLNCSPVPERVVSLRTMAPFQSCSCWLCSDSCRSAAPAP